jgi:hypothetical protein
MDEPNQEGKSRVIGEIRIDPIAVEHCLKLGLVQAGILSKELVERCEIHCYRQQGGGEKIGAKILWAQKGRSAECTARRDSGSLTGAEKARTTSSWHGTVADMRSTRKCLNVRLHSINWTGLKYVDNNWSFFGDLLFNLSEVESG